VSTLSESSFAAGRAFDSIAEEYDQLFTNSKIGRAQRDVVWQRAAALFPSGGHILELNCGTGEDAAFLAERGIEVTACDASVLMIHQARARTLRDGARQIQFHVLPSERINELSVPDMFDGALSNFSGLNCIADLAVIARKLARRMKSGAPALLCLSTRFCIWEMLHYAFRGDMHRAFRRCAGASQVRIGSETFPVYYPTLRLFAKSFHPFFRFRSAMGVGVVVPPSYMEGWAADNPHLFRLCNAIDRLLRGLPGFRVLGDHMLLHLERV
jgi:ubiquinone/menaquinone biosynthesis C-methylase UbiE